MASGTYSRDEPIAKFFPVTSTLMGASQYAVHAGHAAEGWPGRLGSGAAGRAGVRVTDAQSKRASPPGHGAWAGLGALRKRLKH